MRYHTERSVRVLFNPLFYGRCLRDAVKEKNTRSLFEKLLTFFFVCLFVYKITIWTTFIIWSSGFVLTLQMIAYQENVTAFLSVPVYTYRWRFRDNHRCASVVVPAGHRSTRASRPTVMIRGRTVVATAECRPPVCRRRCHEFAGRCVHAGLLGCREPIRYENRADGRENGRMLRRPWRRRAIRAVAQLFGYCVYARD